MAQGSSSSEDVEAALVRSIVMLDPVLGTFAGIEGQHNGLLPPTGPEVRQRIICEARAQAQTMHERVAGASPDEQIDADLALGGVRGLEILEGALHCFDRDPDWYVNSAVQGIYALLLWTDLHERTRLEHMIARLEAVPGFLKTGMAQIVSPPEVLLDNAEGDAEGAVDFFGDDLAKFIAEVQDPATRERLSQGRQRSLQALQEFRRFLETVRPNSTQDFAIGREAFDALLTDVHRLPLQSHELLEMGFEISARTEAEMVDLSQQCAGHPRWWEALEALKGRHPSREGLLDACRDMTLQAERFAREVNLVDMSNTGPLIIRETPAFARTNLPFAAYIQAPPMAASGNSEFWVTPIADGLEPEALERALQRRHIGKQMISAVHEAYPGHHLQACYGATVKRPLRHLFASTLLLEGWALYCEDLMMREEFLADDPQAGLLRIFQLCFSLYRSLRIVIDVSLHCGGMTRQQAVELLVDRHVLSEGEAEAEVMYYCSAPTQPMSYTVGKVLVQRLVERCLAEDPQGGLAAAHRRVLAPGLLPYPLLERAMGLSHQG